MILSEKLTAIDKIIENLTCNNIYCGWLQQIGQEKKTTHGFNCISFSPSFEYSPIITKF
jgi:hypothetical protein